MMCSCDLVGDSCSSKRRFSGVIIVDLSGVFKIWHLIVKIGPISFSIFKYIVLW
jgi:hypothetical protein